MSIYKINIINAQLLDATLNTSLYEITIASNGEFRREPELSREENLIAFA